MKIPVYSLIAYSGTGKTTVMVELIKELKKRGYKVAAIKHDAHDFEIDKEGKDSYRMSKAGSDITVVLSSSKCAFIENRFVDINKVLDRIEGVDLILSEGYSHGNWKKIGIFRKNSGNPLRINANDCFAICSDEKLNCSCNQFDLDDYSGLVSFIIKDLKKNLS
ncbi:MAG: molybdopterin-guanine dinucleotide biosynthesis protein B [Sphaerochaetaceae bacterium]